MNDAELVEYVLRRERGFASIQRIAQSLLAGWKGERVGSEGTAALNREVLRSLERCERIGAPPPKELVDLVAHQLKIDSKARNETRWKRKRTAAVKACARSSKPISNKRLARACGVSLPTIARWKKDPSFSQNVAFLKAHPLVLGPPNKRRKLVHWTIQYDADGDLQKVWADGVDPDRDFLP